MKPFRNVITDPPATPAEWDSVIRSEHRLQNYTDAQVGAMEISHAAKVPLAEKELQDLIDFPGHYLKELSDKGITGQQADQELADKIAYWTWKRDKLKTIVEVCKKDQQLRLNNPEFKRPIR
jgi:hypothetical protein